VGQRGDMAILEGACFIFHFPLSFSLIFLFPSFLSFSFPFKYSFLYSFINFLISSSLFSLTH
jgi:hypothetical protein